MLLSICASASLQSESQRRRFSTFFEASATPEPSPCAVDADLAGSESRRALGFPSLAAGTAIAARQSGCTADAPAPLFLPPPASIFPP